MVDVKNLQVENPSVAQRARAKRDAVDAQLEVWGRELPDLDLETEGIVERIGRLDYYIKRLLGETLEQFDLTHGEWRLMGHLRYAGQPYHGKPGKLAEHLGLSSGAMTNRLDNMERRGLLRRLDDPDDRRGVIVELTEEGHRVWESSVGVQAQKEALVATALDERERRQLNDLLRKLMNAFREEHGPLPHKPHAE
ncbi:MAG TPA: MarR family winged helix-turn-helix transcriptional regulator [Gaiella sp.]|jgi:DNA-binding MarR family transcriptional regulator